MVGFDEAGADEQQVADLDGAAGGGGADVDSLGGAASLKLGVGYSMAVVGVWRCISMGNVLCQTMLMGSLVPYSMPLLFA